MMSFVFLDVDGYCAPRVDQRCVVSASLDGFRARELGWSYYSAAGSGAGSVYFWDGPECALLPRGGSTAYAHRLHGLPIYPGAGSYPGQTALRTSQLLDAIRTICVTCASPSPSGPTLVVVHKGGNEGLWARQALGDAEGFRVITLDLEQLGCPKAEDLSRLYPGARACQFHSFGAGRGAGRGAAHCPGAEVGLLAQWVAGALCADGPEAGAGRAAGAGRESAL